MESPAASAVTSWGNSTILDTLQSSERILYNNYKDDRRSEEDYVPKRVRKSTAADIARGLENSKTTEGNGIGDSKHAEIAVEGSDLEAPKSKRAMKPKKQLEKVEKSPVDEALIPLPSMMPYSSSGNEALMEVLEEMECGQFVPGVEMEMSDEEGEVVVHSTLSDHNTIVRLEKLVMEMRHENDDLKERMEDMVADIKEGKIPCNKCTVANGKGREVPYIPKQVLTRKVEVGTVEKVYVEQGGIDKRNKDADVLAERDNVGYSPTSVV